jgi:hypothetical protein
VQTAQRWLNALALYRMAAWRSHKSTMVGRADPEVPCEVVFAPQEWHTISTRPSHGHPPPAPPALREMVRGLAQLGGC